MASDLLSLKPIGLLSNAKFMVIYFAYFLTKDVMLYDI